MYIRTQRALAVGVSLKEGIDNKTLDGLKKGKNITLLTLERLCQILDCTPNDIVKFVPDNDK